MVEKRESLVLRSPAGSIPVPDGESRLGSDASCPLHVRGEGVLPVHAYVKTDGARLLLRPAEDGAAVTVDNVPLEGPGAVLPGQTVKLGGLTLRLERQRRRDGLWARRRPWFLLWPLLIPAALILLASLAAWIVLDEDEWQRRSEEWLEENLRREVEVGRVEISLLKGLISLHDVKIANKTSFAEEGRFARVAEVRFQTGSWTLFRLLALHSPGSGTFSGQLTVKAPELFLVRDIRNDAPANNYEDLWRRWRKFAKATPWPYYLPFAGGSLRVQIEDGLVRFDDKLTGVGADSFENISLSAEQNSFGEPLRFAFSAAFPTLHRRGYLNAEGRLQLVDANGGLDLKNIFPPWIRLELRDFDPGRVFRHLGWRLRIFGGRAELVPGKPLTGKIELRCDDAEHALIKGEVKSESLVAVRRAGREPLGRLPTILKISSLKLERRNGDWRPQELVLDLLSARNAELLRAPPGKPDLKLQLRGNRLLDGSHTFTAQVNCELEELFDTDFGRWLGLQGRLGGHLRGSLTVDIAPQGETNIDLKVDTTNPFVLVPDPHNPAGPLVRQRTKLLEISCLATARPSRLNPGGAISELEVKKFAIRSNSFSICSSLPAVFRSLDHPQKMYAEAKFQLRLKGREFFREFAPILKIFDVQTPVEEDLDLKLITVGRGGRIEAVIEGTARRQWAKPDEPVALLAHFFYTPANREHGEKPWLELTTLQLGNERNEGGAPFIRLEKSSLRRQNRREILSVPAVRLVADMKKLRERFAPYLKPLLPPLMKYGLFGRLNLDGALTVEHDLFPDAQDAAPTAVAFDLRAELHDAGFTIPVPTASAVSSPAGASAKDKRRPQTDQNRTWREPRAKVSLQGEYRLRRAASHEEPDWERLDVKHLQVEGSCGTLGLNFFGLDLWRLRRLLKAVRAGKAPTAAWTKVVDSFGVSGTFGPESFRRVGEFLHIFVVGPGTSKIAPAKLSAALDYRRRENRLRIANLLYEPVPSKNGKNTNARREKGEENGSPTELPWLRRLKLNTLTLTDVSALPLWTPEGESAETARRRWNPVAWASHLPQGLKIEALDVAAGNLAEKLRRIIPRDGSGPPALFARAWSALRLGAWRPHGTWSIRSFSAMPRPGGGWSVQGLFRTDFDLYRRAEDDAFTAPTFSLRGPWALLPSGLAFSTNKENDDFFGGCAFSGEFKLDRAALDFYPPFLKYDYHKPAKTACVLKVDDLQVAPQGKRFAVGAIRLNGGPLKIAAQNVVFIPAPPPPNWKTGVKKKDVAGKKRAVRGREWWLPLLFQCGALKVSGGPLPFTLADFRWTTAVDRNTGAPRPARDADRLSFRLHVPAADLSYLARAAGLTASRPALRLQGGLTDVVFAGETTFGALKNPRRLRAVPGAPTIRAKLKDIVLKVVDENGERLIGQIVDGGLFLTPQTLTFKNVATATRVAVSSKKKTRFAVFRLRVPELRVEPVAKSKKEHPKTTHSKNVGGNLFAAFDEHAPRLKIEVPQPLRFETMVDAKELGAAASLLWKALSATDTSTAKTSAAAARTEKTWWGNLVFIGGLRAPELRCGPLRLENLRVPRLLLENRELTIPTASGTAWGGSLKLSRLRCGFSVSPPHHAGRFSLRGGRLETPATTFGGVRLLGRVDADGNWHGRGFRLADRASWNGACRFSLYNPVVVTGTADKPPQENARKKTPTPPAPYSPATYLKSFGVAADRLVCRDLLNVPLQLEKGVLHLPTTLFHGKNAGDGLTLSIAGELRLSDRHWREGTAGLSLLRLPPAAKKRLCLPRWPPVIRTKFLQALADGKLLLRMKGEFAAPRFLPPATERRTWARKALFGVARVTNAGELRGALLHLRRFWQGTSRETKQAGAWCRLWGVRLPGTAAALAGGDSSCLDEALDAAEPPPDLAGVVKFLQEARRLKRPLPEAAALRKLLGPEKAAKENEHGEKQKEERNDTAKEKAAADSVLELFQKLK